MRPAQAEIVVLGGGVIGLAIAYEATRRGLRPLVLERGKAGSGAVWAAAGMLAPAAEAESEDQALVELALESCRLYPEFIAQLEADSGMTCGYRTEGTLVVALNRDHAEELERVASFQRRLGLDVAWLDADEVLRREPGLSPRLLGALCAEGDRQVDPRRLVRALRAAIERRGGTIVEDSDITRIESAGGTVQEVIHTVAGETTSARAGCIVAAAGAWTNDLPLDAARELPLRPVKGQVLRLRGEPLIQHVVRTPDVYLVPRASGELVVGATSEELGFDARPTAGAALDLLREAWRVLPGIADLELAEQTVSFRPALRDNLPCIGPVADTAGMFVATGHYRHGVMLAPVTARLLLDCIETGSVPPLLASFQVSRFAGAGSMKGAVSR